MREIIFRGQTRRNGEKVWMDGRKVPSNWVYGGVLQGTGSFSIIYGCNDVDDKHASNLEKHVVYTDTLGQYTGLTDKNGKKIFEGDIAKATTTNGKTTTICKIGIGLCEETDSDVQCMGVYVYFDDAPFVLPCNEEYKDLLEIIGNIHDNPELLKGGAEK